MLTAIMESNNDLNYKEMKDQVRSIWKRRVRDEIDSAAEDAAKATLAKGGSGHQKITCHGCGEPAGYIRPN